MHHVLKALIHALFRTYPLVNDEIRDLAEKKADPLRITLGDQNCCKCPWCSHINSNILMGVKSPLKIQRLDVERRCKQCGTVVLYECTPYRHICDYKIGVRGIACRQNNR